MKERVYLGDWLFNAGIVGFLNINNHLWEINNTHGLTSKDENLLKFNENYIEFDRNIFEGFSKRFFDYAFNLYGRYENLLNLFKEFLLDLQKLKDNEIKNNLPIEILDRFKNILESFKLLKIKLGKVPTKRELKKDIFSLIPVLKKAIEIMKKDKNEFWETDVQIFLRKIFGQKSFLNLSVNKDRFKKFYQEFEKPILDNKIIKDKKYYCILCNKEAKKNVHFDTGLSKFYGLNPDVVNFVWNFKSKLPLCEICEIIYFSYFAGIIPVKKDNKTIYYFVNSDGNIEDLVRENLSLSKHLEKNILENALLEFFTQLILEASTEKARYFLQNISVLELDLTNGTMPKVYSFNLTKKKAEFFKNNKNLLSKLSRTYYQIKDLKISVLPEFVNLILKNEISFNYLNKLLKIFIATQNKSNNYKTNISTYQIQLLNILLKNFWRIDMNISEKEIWYIYNKGIDFSKILKDKKAENKIQSIAYKLLNALRIGDVNNFMDVLIRIYMAYGEEIPSTFNKVLYNKESFYILGYSFLNGLLGKKFEGDNNGSITT